MQNLVSENTLPSSPDDFHPELPPGIRAALIEFVLREINRDFVNNAGQVIDEFVHQNPRLNSPTAFLLASQQIETQIKPYKSLPEKILSPMRITLNNALDLEKAGEVDAAAVLFEKLLSDSFPVFTPYERLRIIYTKQHYYDEAIRVCQKYIEVLKSIQEFDPGLRNLEHISKYENYVEKLKSKTGGISKKPTMYQLDKDKNIIKS